MRVFAISGILQKVVFFAPEIHSGKRGRLCHRSAFLLIYAIVAFLPVIICNQNTV